MFTAVAEMRRLAEQKRADAAKARSLVAFVPARADKDRMQRIAADLEREAEGLDRQAEVLN